MRVCLSLQELIEPDRHACMAVFTWKLQQDGTSNFSIDLGPWNPAATEPSTCPNKDQNLAEQETLDAEAAPASNAATRAARLSVQRHRCQLRDLRQSVKVFLRGWPLAGRTPTLSRSGTEPSRGTKIEDNGVGEQSKETCIAF